MLKGAGSKARITSSVPVQTVNHFEVKALYGTIILVHLTVFWLQQGYSTLASYRLITLAKIVSIGSIVFDIMSEVFFTAIEFDRELSTRQTSIHRRQKKSIVSGSL